MISNVLSTGLQGLNRSLQGAEKAASDIANASISNQGAGNESVSQTAEPAADIQTNLPESLVELRVYEQSFAASAKVVETADRTIGTLLDIKA